MEILEHLEAYLGYMGQVGFTGLALEHNPFAMPKPAPARPAPRQPARLVAGVARPDAPPPPKAPPKPRPRPAKPNLLDIMQTVAHTSPHAENAERVAAVGGADSVEVLKNLYRTFATCQACALGTTRSRFVFGEGSHQARVLFVGGGPSPEDDRAGRPFTGETGALFDRILKAMKLDRNRIFVTHVVKCGPPEGRSPLPDETATCAPILERQIETVDPQVIVALGATALRFFKGPDASLVRCRGQFFTWRKRTVMSTFEPAYILRNPVTKREVWHDLQQVMARLK